MLKFIICRSVRTGQLNQIVPRKDEIESGNMGDIREPHLVQLW